MTTKAATILIVDDDPGLVELLAPALKAAGYKVRAAQSADQAVSFLAGTTVDLLLLDYQLPGLSGLKLLEILKKDPRTASLPVIIQTTRGSEADKVEGLKTGADDYLAKPFSVKELLARVEALLRRARQQGRTDRVLEAAGIRVGLDSRTVTAKGKTAELTPIEFDLLVRLVQHPGQVLTYQVLSEALSEGSRILTSENLYAHVKNLRRKLGPAGERIATVYGIGYKLES